MHRLVNRNIVSKRSIDKFRDILKQRVKVNVRSVASGSDALFPSKVDFPSRHIGPRDHDVVTMLDLLGYKVSVG